MTYTLHNPFLVPVCPFPVVTGGKLHLTVRISLTKRAHLHRKRWNGKLAVECPASPSQMPLRSRPELSAEWSGEPCSVRLSIGFVVLLLEVLFEFNMPLGGSSGLLTHFPFRLDLGANLAPPCPFIPKFLLEVSLEVVGVDASSLGRRAAFGRLGLARAA